MESPYRSRAPLLFLEEPKSIDHLLAHLVEHNALSAPSQTLMYRESLFRHHVEHALEIADMDGFIGVMREGRRRNPLSFFLCNSLNSVYHFDESRVHHSFDKTAYREHHSMTDRYYDDSLANAHYMHMRVDDHFYTLRRNDGGIFVLTHRVSAFSLCRLASKCAERFAPLESYADIMRARWVPNKKI